VIFPALSPNLSLQVIKDWKVVFIAILAEQMGMMPSDSEIDESLEMMIDSINKGDISKFVCGCPFFICVKIKAFPYVQSTIMR
jgi:hypothetical protein